MDKNFRKALNRIQKAIEEKSTELDLSRLELRKLPREFLELTNLQVLNLGGNLLTSFPESLVNLDQLTNLDLSNNQLTSLSESVGSLIKLTKLDLRNNQLTSLPEDIGKLTELTTLFLRKNQLTSLPESIVELAELTGFGLNSNQLTLIPDNIGELTKLTRLDLRNNQLTSLPEDIGKLTELTTLYLTNNQLTSLPETICELTRLTKLFLSDNKLTSLPDNIGNLIELTAIFIRYNELSKTPESIGKLTELTTLDLSNNVLTSLPESLGKLAELRTLDLSNNLLTSIFENLGKLTKLIRLDLSNNELTSLPENIEKLSFNRLSLDLNRNRFKVGVEVYELSTKEQIGEILNWQRAQQTGTLQSIHEAKAIFIGESDFGKTHLIEFLQRGEIERKITTTHGIERSQIKIPYEDRDITLNIWDLGGQKFMRSTHQFFFSERTLYVLVTLARRERNELNYWLKLANQLGNKAPVLVVINKIDIDPHDLDRKSLERDYPNIVGFVRTCIYDCDDNIASEKVALLKRKITSIVTDKNKMPGVFEERPPEWFTVKKQLEELEADGLDFITYKEYEDLEFIKDLDEDERKRNLKLLGMIGAVISFVDDPRLIDTNVINPQWIMDGVYAIINDPKVKSETKGRLKIEDLGRILPKEKFPKERHVYLLELMKKFDLCYAAKDQRDEYLIPDLFEDIEPDYEWAGENSMHFRYTYDDFPPDIFMTRFIVEMHQDIVGEKRWRSGVYISNGACQAKVYQTYRKNYIHIEVTGNREEGRSYLYAIRETFRKLHKPFPQMAIRQEALFKDYWIDYLRLINREEKNKPWFHDELDQDLPITDILNGYSTPTDRKGGQRHIKIFLACSAELKREREQFEIFIHRENQRLYKEGIFITLELWENFIDAMSSSRLQDEYNRAVKHSDIFVSLFFTKVGKYTEEEFTTAFGQFKKKGKPLVFTYFKDAPLNTEEITDEIKSLLEFREKLVSLGHFRTTYKNVDDLKLQFKNQLEKIFLGL